MPVMWEYANKARGCTAHHPAIRAIEDQDGAESTRCQRRQRDTIHAAIATPAAKRNLKAPARSIKEGCGAKACSRASRFTASAVGITGSSASARPAKIVAACAQETRLSGRVKK